MEMLKRNRRDLLKNATAVATASLASNVWTSVFVAVQSVEWWHAVHVGLAA
jgi:hypothetical protein